MGVTGLSRRHEDMEREENLTLTRVKFAHTISKKYFFFHIIDKNLEAFKKSVRPSWASKKTLPLTSLLKLSLS